MTLYYFWNVVTALVLINVLISLFSSAYSDVKLFLLTLKSALLNVALMFFVRCRLSVMQRRNISRFLQIKQWR